MSPPKSTPPSSTTTPIMPSSSAPPPKPTPPPRHPPPPTTTSVPHSRPAPLPSSAPPPRPAHITTSSWADKLRVTHSQNRISLQPVEPIVRDGILEPPASVVEECTSHWEKYLTGQFLGKKMPFHAVQTLAFKAWKLMGLQEVVQRADTVFYFGFQTREQAFSVLEKGPWMFGSREIFLQHWSNWSPEDPSRASVWIRMPQFPLRLWSSTGLSMVSSMVGRPLALDQQTAERSRLSYARVLVELDAARPPPKEVRWRIRQGAEPRTIQVKYEAKPPRCPICCEFGHYCDPDSDSEEEQAPAGSTDQVSTSRSRDQQAPSGPIRDRAHPQTSHQGSARAPLATPQTGHQARTAAQTAPQTPTQSRGQSAQQGTTQQRAVSQTGRQTPSHGHQAQTPATRRLSPPRESHATPCSSSTRTPLCVMNSQASPPSSGSRFSPLDADLEGLSQLSCEDSDSAHSSQGRRKATLGDFMVG